MLVHENLHRAEQLARHWVAGGCPVVIHVDSNVPEIPRSSPLWPPLVMNPR